MNTARAARRHGPRQVGDVAVAYIRPAQNDGVFTDTLALLCLQNRGGHITSLIGCEASRIPASRNQVVRQFLTTTDANWLCWFDADMDIPADFVEAVRSIVHPVDRPIVGGLCFAGGRTKMTPTLYVFDNTSGRLESETVLSYPPNELVQVDGTGSACVMIHRSVFEKIAAGMPPDYPMPWYQDQIIEGKDWGEDLVFCLRAKSFADASIWVHTGIKVGHRKQLTLDEAMYVRYTAQLDAKVGGPTVFTEDTFPQLDLQAAAI